MFYILLKTIHDVLTSEQDVCYNLFEVSAMDKRITQTTEKIYNAFADVLLEKEYGDLTIQDVLDKSGIARSTFYAHYKTKDDLLKSICTSIFGHVFSHTVEEEKSHDFSKSSIFDYKHFITHIFYHLHDEKTLVHAILLSQSKDTFLNYLRNGLREFANACVDNNFVTKNDLPKELKANSIIENFVLIVEYWDHTAFQSTPETLTDYFLLMNE